MNSLPGGLCKGFKKWLTKYLFDDTVAQHTDAFMFVCFSTDFLRYIGHRKRIPKLKFSNFFTPRLNYGEMIFHYNFCICERIFMMLPFK